MTSVINKTKADLEDLFESVDNIGTDLEIVIRNYTPLGTHNSAIQNLNSRIATAETKINTVEATNKPYIIGNVTLLSGGSATTIKNILGTVADLKTAIDSKKRIVWSAGTNITDIISASYDSTSIMLVTIVTGRNAQNKPQCWYVIYDVKYSGSNYTSCTQSDFVFPLA